MASISFANVSKIYSRQSRQFFYQAFIQTWSGRRPQPIYALRDVSFRVSGGESLGIIGHNGAGKTTVLNLTAGLTIPERGAVQVGGKVMALLELGSGFHPDLTGEENLRVNASLHGLSRREVHARFDRIVEFSELGDFIREPLRTYSQGMILRLAFSVAAHLDSDILLLDEVLAVGDQDFQRKCINRLHEMKREGKILLCVSHAPEILAQLCERGLWIEGGRVVRQGSFEEVLAAYQSRAMPTAR